MYKQPPMATAMYWHIGAWGLAVVLAVESCSKLSREPADCHCCCVRQAGGLLCVCCTAMCSWMVRWIMARWSDAGGLQRLLLAGLVVLVLVWCRQLRVSAAFAWASMLLVCQTMPLLLLCIWYLLPKTHSEGWGVSAMMRSVHVLQRCLCVRCSGAAMLALSMLPGR